MTFPHELLTPRLRLRKPRPEDAGAIYSRYAGDPEVTRYLSWPTHRSVDDTRAFLTYSESAWNAGTSLAYLVERLSDGELLGSTGLVLESSGCCSTGYVFARDSWRRGYASESLAAMLKLAFSQPTINRVYALCDAEHRASAAVMEKCGMHPEGLRRAHTILPNLSPHPRDMLCYALARGSPDEAIGP
jgi:ribosomal-protein-alanine N-acetyltransferase